MRGALLALGVLAYLVLGGVAPIGFCFEADGHVELEMMRAGSCASARGIVDTAPAEFHEHAGASEHCVECSDLIVPLETVASKKDHAPTPLAVVPLDFFDISTARYERQPARRPFAHSPPTLRQLSTVVLLT